MSERKGDEMPIFFAKARKDKSALSRNSWIRWPKEISIVRQLRVGCTYRLFRFSGLARASKDEDAPLLRNLDKDPGVRASAVKARAHWLARASKDEDLPLLRDLSKDKDPGVRAEALKALANAAKDKDLSELHNQALASNHNFAVEAVYSLVSRCSRHELETFLDEHDQQLCVEALVALDELLYMPEWLKAGDREQEMDLLQLESRYGAIGRDIAAEGSLQQFELL
jgi:hypothetical protein